MTTASRLYLSTAIPFVNARPHLGFALELCIADALARHARARGDQVHFVTGSDDHSLKNVLAAEQAGVPTPAFVREHAQRFSQLAASLGVTHDAFISTSVHPQHAACVHALWRRCAARGDLYKRSYSGLYCVGCERFCDPDETSCTEHIAPLERVTEENWFFRLARFTDLLRERIAGGALRITPESAQQETLALLRQRLPDLCVSRSAARARGWGVPVPDDADQVIWVWFDALAYYLTALDFGTAPAEAFEQRWTQTTRRVHVIGKGITRFHALIWPAILSSAGLAWPTHLLVHGYLTHAGAKISKSGTALDPLPLLGDFGADAVRYYLLRHVRTTRDGDFSHERFVTAYNAELANGLGNLAQRIFGLVQRSNGGVIPAATAAIDEQTLELVAHVRALPGEVDRALAQFAIDEALDSIFSVIDACNRCIDRTAPWALIKRGELTAANGLLRTLLEALHSVCSELAPFLPFATTRLHEALGPTLSTETQWNALREGWRLPSSLQLFPRRDAFPTNSHSTAE